MDTTHDDRNPDADLIEALGGPSEVARRLGFTPQRVQNWKRRGIPEVLRYKRPDIFGPAPANDEPATQPEAAHG